MICWLAWLSSGCSAQSKNGFDLEAGRASFLKADSWALDMVCQGQAKAYPINILNWHEVVNDCFGDEPALLCCGPMAEENPQ